MLMNRWRQLREVVDRISGQLDQLDRRTEKMEVILMVREPAAGVAAEAYDGLRKQVVAAMTERMAHLQQLVQLDAALTAGADADVIGKLVRGFADQASLGRVTDAEHPDRDMLFELVDDLGGRPEVLEPAYVDMITGRVIRRGSMRRAAPPALPGRTQASWGDVQ
ncbi:MAG: hypothetical protein ACRDOL_35815 [Streptosporangiaceae bacterium]